MDAQEARMDDMSEQIDSMADQIKKINNRIDFLELQIKSTESNLKSEIHKSEGLILDEVERIHNILNRHMADPKAHSA